MSSRVSPAERLRGEIDQVFAESGDLVEAIEQVAVLGARLLLQTALESELTVFLNRDRYARSSRTEDPRPGMRNGYAPVTVKTTAGPVTLARPKVRGTTEAFASQLFGAGVTRTNALEALVIAGFVRGLSTRDVEAALVEALGPNAGVSRSTVSRICEELKEQFEAWQRRQPYSSTRKTTSSPPTMQPSALRDAFQVPAFSALNPAATSCSVKQKPSTTASPDFLAKPSAEPMREASLGLHDEAPRCRGLSHDDDVDSRCVSQR